MRVLGPASYLSSGGSCDTQQLREGPKKLCDFVEVGFLP